MFLSLSLLACGGLDQETTIQELRVVAIQSEPAEISVAEFPAFGVEGVEDDPDAVTPVANILLADPLEEGYQLAVWQCTNFGDGCLEAELAADNPELWIWTAEGTELEVQIPIANNPVWQALLQSPELEQPIGVTGLWILACAPNQCEILSNALNGSWDLDAFANPFGLMTSLPIERSSLAFRTLYVSQETVVETRLQNPLLTVQTEGAIVSTAEKPAELIFDIELFQRDPDRASIYGYATIGGFDSNTLVNNILDSLSLEKSLTWYVSEEEEQVGASTLYVVVDDGLGGVNYWRSEGAVQ